MKHVGNYPTFWEEGMEDLRNVSFGELLQALRKRSGMNQQRLADVLGVHRSTIGTWERGDYLPKRKEMVLELARHLQLSEQETRQLLEASLTALSPYWSVPLPRNPFFTGREELLTALHQQLAAGQIVAVNQTLALHGLGGVGKTQVALEYTYRHVLDYQAVFWIEAEQEEQILAGLLHIAEVLELRESAEADQQRIVAAVLQWLATHSDWLLVWDNVEDFELLARY